MRFANNMHVSTALNAKQLQKCEMNLKFVAIKSVLLVFKNVKISSLQFRLVRSNWTVLFLWKCKFLSILSRMNGLNWIWSRHWLLHWRCRPGESGFRLLVKVSRRSQKKDGYQSSSRISADQVDRVGLPKIVPVRANQNLPFFFWLLLLLSIPPIN